MVEEMDVGCARPTGGPVGEPTAKEDATATTPIKEAAPMIKVGKRAPDFVAPAYQQGRFISVKLSEYLGKWVLRGVENRNGFRLEQGGRFLLSQTGNGRKTLAFRRRLQLEI